MQSDQSISYVVTANGREGNRRSDVALLMRHGLQWFIDVRTQCPSKADDEHLVYIPLRGVAQFTHGRLQDCDIGVGGGSRRRKRAGHGGHHVAA